MSDDLTTAYMLGAEQMRDKLRKQAEEIEKLNDTRIDYIVKINKLVDERANLRKESERLRGIIKESEDMLQNQMKTIERLLNENDKLRNALFAIVNEVGFHNPTRMTTEISDKLLYEAVGLLNDKT